MKKNNNKLPIPISHFICPKWGTTLFSFDACRDKCGVDFTGMGGDVVDWKTKKFHYCVETFCRGDV